MAEPDQDRNAGGLGDLLKHFWLLNAIEALARRGKTGGIAYMESHAGAGLYPIAPGNLRALGRRRQKVCAEVSRWRAFDRLQRLLKEGLYIGSFGIALQRLAELKQEHGRLRLSAALWEGDPAANARIWAERDRLIPARMDEVIIRNQDCAPERFAQAAKSARDEGLAPIWLCGPSWGPEKEQSPAWSGLLERLPETCGLLFASAPGNPRRQGPERFDYRKRTGIERDPDFRVDGSARSYALYLTEAAKRLLIS